MFSPAKSNWAAEKSGTRAGKKGRDPQVIANYQIIKAVRDSRDAGSTVEDAVAKVADHFALSDSQVLKLWSNRV